MGMKVMGIKFMAAQPGMDVGNYAAQKHPKVIAWLQTLDAIHGCIRRCSWTIFNA
ncbi:hypothetical protein [Mesorhizobium escarrei]|uniref:hypothetical protein n=1 Tax=Mesorhizobium escarrei TaxID=666018 RepID=UPI0020A7CC40|nr:hypothetical protein [Mesorhizobium escarrei]